MVIKKKKAAKKRPAVKKSSKKIVRKSKVIRKKLAKKPVVKKTSKKTSKKFKKPAVKKLDVIGVITHYFPHVRAAVIKLKAPLSVGDTIKIKGHTTDFIQKISSLQIDRVPVAMAKKGQEIGLLVDSRVRQHDAVCKV